MAKDKSIEKKSNLSPVAQEVAPVLQDIHEELRKVKEEVGTDLVSYANEIVREEMEGKDVTSKKINFRLALAKVKSKLLIQEKEERKQRIAKNFIGKVDREISG